MAADTAVRLGFRYVRRIAVSCKDRVAGVEGDDGIWVSGGVV